MLQPRFSPPAGDDDCVEVGIDEAGRGPLFGRVYAAAVVLPPPPAFNHGIMKDSKRFHSKKKLGETAEYIKDHALAWSVQWQDEDAIDRMNIRNATHAAMHAAARHVVSQLHVTPPPQVLLVVDGNDFQECLHVMSDGTMQPLPHVCVEGGDNKYTMVAAASILAKTARDAYIDELCELYPALKDMYALDSNKGYGAKSHLDGIKTHGITKWHRKSFGICKTAPLTEALQNPATLQDQSSEAREC